MPHEVIVYSHERCVPCRVLKRFLQEREVLYTLKDVTRDRAALAEFERLGGRLPPLTVVDGQVVVGFDFARLETLLDDDEAAPA